MAIADTIASMQSHTQSAYTAINNKGGTIPAQKNLENLATSINSISSSAPYVPYVRPADRLTKPTINNNEIYWLFGVGADSPNDMALQLSVNSGSYQVDWGDGNVETIASGVTAEHIYDYNNTGITSTPDSRGYKEVWIKATPVAPAVITSVNINVRPSTRPTASTAMFEPQVLEFYVRASSMTTLMFGNDATTNRYTMCEIVGLQENSLTNANYMFVNMYALRKIDNLNINNISGLSYGFMGNCYSYNEPFPSGLTFANFTNDFMASCLAYNQPFPSSTTFANITSFFMRDCRSYNQPFPNGVIFANVTSNFMLGCHSYNQNFPNTVTFASINASFMSSCTSYNQPFPSNITFANVTSDFMYNCISYNQKFSNNVTFANANIDFMINCKAYNQPFPSTVTFANITSGFMTNCSAYNQPITITRSVANAFETQSFLNMYALKSLRINNWQSVANNSLDLSNTSLSKDALVALFNDLPQATTGTNTITITNAYGASALTTADIAICENKGYTLVR